MRITPILIILLFLCVSCQPNADTKHYSVGFDIALSGDTTHITVYSPWQKNNVMAEYALTQALNRVVCTSATHIGFMHELGLTDKVVGVCRPERIYNLSDEQRQGIVDIGDDIRPNMETILMLQPDAVIISTYAEGDEVPKQIEGMGIPVVYCNEWTETTPLARAEWIRFFGAIFGCLEQADSIYQTVKEGYEARRREGEKAKEPTPNPSLEEEEFRREERSIMSGMSFRGTWYVPTGGTFMGNLFRDAGAKYYYEDNHSTSSLPLTMEQALQDFSEADVWVGCNAYSLDELKAIDSKHTWFKAYQTRKVYNFYRRALPTGANDFWESGTVHPERILSDLQHIMCGDTTKLHYASPLR